MLSRVAVALSLAIAVGMRAPLLAGTIPCENSTTNECTSAPTCQVSGICRGEPIREGQPCTQEVASGGCMTSPICKHGVCSGTVPVADGTECNFAGLEKCYSPGSCRSIPLAGLSFCTLGTPKTCQQPSDPCKAAFCNPQSGNCEMGDRCFTFSGCETCDAGACHAVNLGGACANPEGDFNECTTGDHCVLLGTSALSEVNASTGTQLPPALAAAMGGAQQVLPMRGICMGSAGGALPTATPTTVTPPTPTVGPGACTGDCSGDGEVTVNELIAMVNIALGTADVSTCLAGDANGNGEITVDEIVNGVNRALNGCGG